MNMNTDSLAVKDPLPSNYDKKGVWWSANNQIHYEPWDCCSSDTYFIQILSSLANEI